MTLEEQVVDAADAHRFELRGNTGEVAVLAYRRSPGMLHLLDTQVPPSLEVKGYGSALVRAALEQAKREGVAVGAVCPFVRRWVQRHPEYATMVKY